MTRGLLSIVVPVFNEGAWIEEAHRQIGDAMASALPALDYEIMFVDDGSVDDSFAHIQRLASAHPNVKAIRFAANCGSHMAIRAGLEHAGGDAACFLACDLQEPPSLIPLLLAALEPPYDIVWAVRNSTANNSSNRFLGRIYYSLGRALVSRTIPPSGATMFMVDAKVLAAINRYTERNLTLDGLLSTLGFKSQYLYYQPRPRTSGQSKWTVGKKVKHWIDFFVGNTFFPMRMVTVVGVSFSLVGVAWTIYLVLRKVLYGDIVPGWTALSSILLIGFGITNISLGIIAEYLWRTLDETRRRPRYIIDEKLNLT